MSDYSKITNFLSKDSLALNDPSKYVKGSELDAEYNAIAVAIATKADTGGTGSFTTLTASGLFTLNSGQIAFPVSQVASANANTLDDYEEGTWTPVLTFATPGDLSIAYSNQTGIYTKVGRVVNISLLVVSSSFTHTTASGALNITGLPFANNSTMQSYFSCDWVGITKADYTQATFEVAASASLLTLQMSGSGQVRATVSASDMPTGGGVRFRASGAYQTA